MKSSKCPALFVIPAMILWIVTAGFGQPAGPGNNRNADEVPSHTEAIRMLSDFELGQVKLLPSPFKHAMQTDGNYLMDLDPDRLLAPYFTEAGLEPKAPNYGGWENTELRGHTLGHYLSALSMIYAATGKEKYRRRVDYIVSELDSAQQHAPNNFLGGIPDHEQLFDSLRAGKLNETAGFSLNGVWSPWYNLHKAYAGLRDAYHYTGNQEAKKVLVKYADWAVDLAGHLDEPQFQKMLQTEYGGMNEVMADVYSITGNKKYLELAERFNHKKFFDPLARGEDNLKGLHSNTQIPKVIGAAREYELTKNQRLEEVAKTFWNDVALKRSYVIGGNSFNEYFGEQGQLSKRLGRGTAETCNTYNMLKLTKHLMQWEPKPQYADFYERALYNHILASQDPETGMFTYLMSLDPGGFKTFSNPYDSFWCCVGTGMENHTKYGTNIYLHSGNELYVNLFIPSVLKWKQKGLQLRQETKFPENGEVKMKVRLDQPLDLALQVRRPGWAGEGYTIRVNGKKVEDLPEAGSYVNIQRTWKDGDRVAVSLPMEPRLEYMPNDKSKVAIMYGPVVLAGELGNKWFFDPMPMASDHTQYFDVPSVSVPDLKFGDKPVSEWIQRIPDEPLHFMTVGVGQPHDVTLAPFYKVNRQHYTVYWDVIQ